MFVSAFKANTQFLTSSGAYPGSNLCLMLRMLGVHVDRKYAYTRRVYFLVGYLPYFQYRLGDILRRVNMQICAMH